jgi:HEAT repeats/Bacterial SH3 domain
MESDPTQNESSADTPTPEENGGRASTIVQSLANITRPVTTVTERERRAPAQAANAALRERIHTLLSALGDPTHPLHQRSVDDLVSIGPAAVPQLCDALNPQRPWLTAYRAAEALGRIGDGRAAGPLLDALRHSNSNVRWSAVRALATVGDARALIELRRVARSDLGKTSWGESVGGAAQSVLDQMQGQNVLLRGADLLKTAVACVVMLVALILAWTFMTALRTELKELGRVTVVEDRSPIVRTALPTIPVPTSPPRPTAAVAPTLAASPPSPTAALGGAVIPPDGAIATVVASGNVRAQPTRSQNNVIGAVNEGDQVIVVASTSDQQWYRIALGAERSASSRIDTPDQTGWVARSLLSPIAGQVPVEEVQTPAAPTVAPEPPTPTPTS